MRLLLDTHALLWWWIDDPQLSQRARASIEDSENEVLVSAASAWEIATKHSLDKLGLVDSIVQRYRRCWPPTVLSTLQSPPSTRWWREVIPNHIATPLTACLRHRRRSNA